MLKELDLAEFGKYGIQISGSEMDNGEIRFRLSTSNSAYIRTETRNHTNWQNSHYHSEQTEYYFVEKGDVVFVTVEKDKVNIQNYNGGSRFCVCPRVPHNIKLSENCVMHTMKCGGRADWNPYPELDTYLKGGIINE